MKKNHWTLIAMFILLVLVGIIQANAATFGVEVNICRPYWYCTAYSLGSCGDRSCTDINSCGINLDKPVETLECVVKGGSSGGGGTGTNTPITYTTPEGYFTLNTDVIKLNIEQNKVVQKIISINGTESKEYNLEIEYPSSYTKGTDFLTTSGNQKQIDMLGDFNIIIDTRSILVGTYVIPIKIYNDKYSRKITAIIDVVPVKNAVIDLKVDSVIKTLGADKGIVAEVNIRDNSIVEGDNVTFYLLDPKGNIIVSEEKTVDSKKSTEVMKFPSDMEEGYYTLSIKINSASGTYAKSATFTVLTPNKYLPILETPRKTINIITILIWAGIIVIIVTLILANSGLFNQYYPSGRRRRYSRFSRWKMSMSTPDIKISFKKGGLMNKFKKLSQVFKLKKKDREYKLEMLKNSYEKGFISLKEYRDSLREQGFTVESKRVSDYYDELKNKEKIETLAKQESEKETELKISEEQKKAIARAEAAVLKQETQLKREIEEEKKQQEAKEKVKIINEKEQVEDEKSKKQRENYGDKVLIQPAHIVPKDNILDKKVGDSKAFVLNNGEKLYCVRDLLNALEHNSEQVINHHTKYGRHDFANWIGDVFQYYDVAEELRKVTDKDDLIKVLKKYN